MRNLLQLPEFNIAIFSFFLHFIWEFVQVPTYAGMADMNHWQGVKVCMSATFGDVGFAIIAFYSVSLFARSRRWFACPENWQLLIFIGVGIALTIGFEYYYTNISLRWTYSNLMPLVPPFGTGLSPMLQWIFIPPLALWFTRRQIAGATTKEKIS
jgi:hypothetical protein